MDFRFEGVSALKGEIRPQGKGVLIQQHFAAQKKKNGEEVRRKKEGERAYSVKTCCQKHREISQADGRTNP